MTGESGLREAVEALRDEWWAKQAGAGVGYLQAAVRLTHLLAAHPAPVPAATLTEDERKVVADLRREIGAPTDRDGRWQPMVSAGEVRALLGCIDRLAARQPATVDAVRKAWEADVLRRLVTGPVDERWVRWFPDMLAAVTSAMLGARGAVVPAPEGDTTDGGEDA